MTDRTRSFPFFGRRRFDQVEPVFHFGRWSLDDEHCPVGRSDVSHDGLDSVHNLRHCPLVSCRVGGPDSPTSPQPEHDGPSRVGDSDSSHLASGVRATEAL